MPTRTHSQKISVKKVKQKRRYLYTWRQYGKAYKRLGFICKIRSSP